MSLRSEKSGEESTDIYGHLLCQHLRLHDAKPTLEETHGGGGEDEDSGGYCSPIHDNPNRALMMMVTPSFCRYLESVGSCSPSPSPSMDSAGLCSHSDSTESAGSFFSPIVDLEFLQAGTREHDLHCPAGENSAANVRRTTVVEISGVDTIHGRELFF